MSTTSTTSTTSATSAIICECPRCYGEGFMSLQIVYAAFQRSILREACCLCGGLGRVHKSRADRWLRFTA